MSAFLSLPIGEKAWAEMIGYLAAACTTLSFFPQAWQILRNRRTQDISLCMYVIFAAGIVCWLLYGIMSGSAPVIIANAITLLPVLCILVMKLRCG